MDVAFSRLSWWLWGGKEKGSVAKGSSVNSLPDFGAGKPENVMFWPVRGPDAQRKNWNRREERRIDKEYDVLVPSDDVSLSGYESDESDWSVGWLEPHAPGFRSHEEEEEEDSGFAVLVPCYRDDRMGLLAQDPSNQFLNAIKNLANDYSPEGKKCMEEWLSSLEKF
ncbi:unnamed protein product [Cuscuta epithymum]|uniref:Uncharacterized protein n=2 Tax=Cuscuta epithymum TaxID=186058 RepID=A0AAV0GMS1_9ASTE|nr:unnamed protein product [Cuscuta epithymum]CAH9148995.1 unnamed protein product [Cuscuta epithymum]